MTENVVRRRASIPEKSLRSLFGGTGRYELRDGLSHRLHAAGSFGEVILEGNDGDEDLGNRDEYKAPV